ncbi:MAG: hypothetical protein H7Y59_13630 [Anaerolineales bacterium]|nr:hypothetical protein [Anaerolineales bacterium]
MDDDDYVDLYETPVVYVEQPDIPLCSAFDNQGYIMDLVVEKVEIPHKFLWLTWHSAYQQVVLKQRIPLLKDVNTLSEKLMTHLIKHSHIPQNELRGLTLESLILLVKGT